MAKLLMLKGLPASGKSTFAREQVALDPENIVRVNKDTIRASFGEPWSRELEKKVVTLRNRMIVDLFKVGCPLVISDDTNLAPKHEQALRNIARECGADFEVNDSFLKVPVEECIRRDSLREGKAQVGEKVIRDMAEQFLTPKVKKPTTQPVVVPDMVPYVQDPTLPSAIICDLDGTLALHNGRSPYDYAKCDTDLINEPIWEVIEALSAAWFMDEEYENKIIYLSGREDSSREKTAEWLNRNSCPPGPLFMRKSGDHRKDSIVKYELFDKHIRGKYNVLFVLDDRPQVLRMWRAMGVFTLQVGDGHEF
jgi:predicted kinase